MRRAWVLLAGALAACETIVSREHPLDPLTKEEVQAAVGALNHEEGLRNGRSLVSLALRDPPKNIASPPREAFAVILDRSANETYEAVVDLDQGRVGSWKPVPGVQPMLVGGDYELAEELARADPRWQAAMRERGITDFDRVHLDTWAPGESTFPGAGGARLLRAIAFWRGSQRNRYGPPVEGVIATVDVTNKRVLEVTNPPVVPIAETSTEFRARSSTRSSRSSGASRAILVRGHEILWENWRFRWSFHPREGLVLHEVVWKDGERSRSILHRASVAEMWVPYGDPADAWKWRNAFDEGEYGLGVSANRLAPGSGAPEGAVLLDAVFADEEGEPYVREGVVAVYERDGGILWGHSDFARPERGAPRGRELAIGFVATVGNYDYGYRWILHQDGRIEFETELTGILLTKGVNAKACSACRTPPDETGTIDPRGEERHGVLLAPNLLGTNHQHFLSLRLDLDVDGTANSVRELNVRPDPDDPTGTGFVAVRTILRREGEAQRDLSLAENRCWEVFNPSVSNAAGHPSGYTLVSGKNAVPYMSPDHPARKIAGFVGHHVWVTRMRPEELYAAGDYPNQAREPGGLPVYVADDEPLENHDVVLWYTLGVTHVARPEEFPVMPVARAGFELVPTGFFDRNPTVE